MHSGMKKSLTTVPAVNAFFILASVAPDDSPTREWQFIYRIKHRTQVYINKNFQRKIVNIFLPIIFSICFGCSKNRLIKTVLLSTHIICFG